MPDPRWAISDIHLGSRNAADDFNDVGHGSESLLIDWLQDKQDGTVIVIGDLFDLWRAKLHEIENSYANLIPLLFRKMHTYVVGNHDQWLIGNMTIYRGVPIVPELRIDGAIFTHGNRWDPVNAYGSLSGEVITEAEAWFAARFGHGIAIASEEIADKAQSLGRHGDPMAYREYALSYAKEQGEKAIYIGHTHVADRVIQDGITYQNAGTWVNGEKGWAKL